jgi:pyrroloquinoline quinone biosynthesis protein D
MADSPLAHDVPLSLGSMYRLQWEPAQGCYVLLFPEGLIRLEGGAGEIMKRIDGHTTLDGVVTLLEGAFPGSELRGDVVEFLDLAHAKGWVRSS